MMFPRFDYKKESAMFSFFVSLIRERQIHKHIYREIDRESDNVNIADSFLLQSSRVRAEM